MTRWFNLPLSNRLFGFHELVCKVNLLLGHEEVIGVWNVRVVHHGVFREGIHIDWLEDLTHVH
jgi:hypothetical protein